MTIDKFRGVVQERIDELENIVESLITTPFIKDVYYDCVDKIQHVGFYNSKECIIDAESINYELIQLSKQLLVTGYALYNSWINDRKPAPCFAQFKQILEETLIQKGSQYAGNGDRLENFNIQAEILNTSPSYALSGNVAKHLANVNQWLIKRGVRPPEELAIELAKDIACYGILLFAVILNN